MTTEQAEKLEKLFDANYLIIISDSGYIDTHVKSIYSRVDTGDVEVPDGEDEREWRRKHLVYDSEVFSERPLIDVCMDSVHVFSQLQKNWTDVDGEEMQQHYMNTNEIDI